MALKDSTVGPESLPQVDGRKGTRASRARDRCKNRSDEKNSFVIKTDVDTEQPPQLMHKRVRVIVSICCLVIFLFAPFFAGLLKLGRPEL